MSCTAHNISFWSDMIFLNFYLRGLDIRTWPFKDYFNTLKNKALYNDIAKHSNSNAWICGFFSVLNDAWRYNWENKHLTEIYIFFWFLTGCTITFADHGTEVTSIKPYWIGSLSLADCQNSCRADLSCGGIGYDTSLSECSKSEGSQSKRDKGCSDCMFFLPQAMWNR